MDSLHGCPVCEWDGKVAETHTWTYRKYTHVIVQDGELFRGSSCYTGRPSKEGPTRRPLLNRTRKWLAQLGRPPRE